MQRTVFQAEAVCDVTVSKVVDTFFPIIEIDSVFDDIQWSVAIKSCELPFVI